MPLSINNRVGLTATSAAVLGLVALLAADTLEARRGRQGKRVRRPKAGDRAAVKAPPKPGSAAWKRTQASRRRVGRATPVNRPPAAVVNLLQLHTGEILPVIGRRLPPARLVNRFFRCRWTNRIAPVDARLIRWLLEAAWHFGATEIQVVSAYRSPKFNDMLRKKDRQVAKRSLHRLGKAVDFRLVGVETDRLYRYLRRRRLGGVGRYPTSKFLHLDVGPIRTWKGT